MRKAHSIWTPSDLNSNIETDDSRIRELKTSLEWIESQLPKIRAETAAASKQAKLGQSRRQADLGRAKTHGPSSPTRSTPRKSARLASQLASAPVVISEVSKSAKNKKYQRRRQRVECRRKQDDPTSSSLQKVVEQVPAQPQLTNTSKRNRKQVIKCNAEPLRPKKSSGVTKKSVPYPIAQGSITFSKVSPGQDRMLRRSSRICSRKAQNSS